MSQQVRVYRKLDLKDAATVIGVACMTKTAAYTVTTEDSGKLIIANHASTQPEFTLPAVASSKGCIWFFASLGATGMKITGGTADKIVTKNDAAADSISYETASEMIGAACIIIGDGTNYYHFDTSGEAVTVTVAT